MNSSTQWFNLIPADIIKFILVTLFSLLIGMEQRRHHTDIEMSKLFGTDRTFTLIGILGFILYIIAPQNLIPFLCGGATVSLLLAIFYFQKIQIHQRFGLTSLVIALVTYCLAPLIYTQPNWLVILIIVTVLVLAEIKETLFNFSQKIDNTEFITLSKFLLFAGVILPLLPHTPISAEINITPYKIWLSIVAVSGISYFSYLLKKFIFPNSGIILTGILGGMYSSTATTVILARKSKDIQESKKISVAIILATTMMYVRIFLLALFFNESLAIKLIPSFLIFIISSGLLALYFYKFYKTKTFQEDGLHTIQPHNNPLEFKAALIFSALFLFFGVITSYVNSNYGAGGINVLSFIVGVTDIDPFILNIFQSKWNIDDSFLVGAVLNAISSNNLLKMVYGCSFGDKSIRLQLVIAFGILIVLGLTLSFVAHF